MVDVRLKYIVEDADRHGNLRIYVRRPGHKKVRIREQPGTPQFMAAYNAAIRGAAQPLTNDRGSFGYVCKAYFANKIFDRLDQSTKAWRQRELEELCEKYGKLPIAMMQPRHIRTMRDEKDTPTTSNQRLKALRALFKWAVEANQAEHNPTLGVERVPSPDTGGHHAWTPEEVAQFEQHYPVGTKPRLAFALAFYTTGRREDVARLGPKKICNGRVVYTQAKNEHRKPVHMDIPLHPELKHIIEQTPHGTETFLVTEQGTRYSPNGLSDMFRKWCEAAGLQGCSLHGLRKATAVLLAELEASPHEIGAITGHRTLHEVERYTRTARQKKLADSAMGKLNGVSHRLSHSD